MIPILSGNVASALGGAYDVANSLRFNDGSSDYLNKTLGTASNRKIFTVSYWIKKTTNGLHCPIVEVASSGGSIGGGENAAQIYFNTSDQLTWYETHGSGVINLSTNRVFRDPNAWYHIMYAIDTTQGTSTNRLKLYINGVQETSFTSGSGTYPSQNLESYINSNQDATYIGRSRYNNKYFDGYMCEVVHVDGTAQSPTDLGEFDEDSPTIWKPKDVSGLTFGTNGFYLDFESSGSLGNDAAGSNNFTVNNLTAIDQTTDTCTNNFCTLNPLINSSGNFSNGNCQLDGGSDNKFVWATMATSMNNSSAGWYYEVKVEHTPDATNGYGIRVGCGSIDFANSQSGGMGTDGGFGMSADTAKLIQNSSAKVTLSDNGGANSQASGIDTANGQILNVAWKNGKCFFGVNGTYIAADGGSDGNPGSDSNQSHDVASSVQGDFWNPIFASSGSAPSFVATIGVNFGNPTFSISSGNADANGYGNFEYAPPTGFYAICSKNLAEYG